MWIKSNSMGMKIKYLAFAFMFASTVFSVDAHNVNIVPAPVDMSVGADSFILTDGMGISIENKSQKSVAECFISDYRAFSGTSLQLTRNDKDAAIRFCSDKSLGDEAYRLEVNDNGVKIYSSSLNGFFYALQSLRLAVSPDNRRSIPFMNVSDSPRFGYRGFMLDVSRYFMPKEEVMKLIDCMSMLKLNKLHLHLTDDNGWRLEIKKYPRLTEVGAWRVNRKQQPFSDRRNPERGEATPIGGFYTQEDMREIIAHAAERCVEIIPEIDIPAHSNAALAAYPHLACPTVDKFIGVYRGLVVLMLILSIVQAMRKFSLSLKMLWMRLLHCSLPSIYTWVEMRLGRLIGKNVLNVRRE